LVLFVVCENELENYSLVLWTVGGKLLHYFLLALELLEFSINMT